jgi:hypothetical protein
MDPAASYHPELNNLPDWMREAIVSLARTFLENYAPGQCDCDRSVGIFNCDACNARALLNLDSFNNPIRDEDDTSESTTSED